MLSPLVHSPLAGGVVLGEVEGGALSAAEEALLAIGFFFSQHRVAVVELGSDDNSEI